jgi:hypothetical protein
MVSPAVAPQRMPEQTPDDVRMNVGDVMGNEPDPQPNAGVVQASLSCLFFVSLLILRTRI